VTLENTHVTCDSDSLTISTLSTLEVQWGELLGGGPYGCNDETAVITTVPIYAKGKSFVVEVSSTQLKASL